MNFKDLEIKRSYISYGTENIADSLIKPALSYTKKYRRSVGYFSSSVLEIFIDGIVSLVRNKGTIQIITSPKLSEADIEAIDLGYAQKEVVVNNSVSNNFYEEIKSLEDEKLKLLIELISRDVLDFRIVVPNNIGDYHDKLGILDDLEGNKIVFYGSSNESVNGYRNNYEKVRVVRSWIEGEYDSVIDEIQEFESLWNGENDYVTTFNFKDSAKKQILQVLDQRKNGVNNEVVKLRDYQLEAIKAWNDNGHQGFFIMATGTGKTWTAIYSAKNLYDHKPIMIVICAPYKHLIKQWSEDIVKVFPEAKVILVSSENLRWEEQINEEIIRSKYNKKNQIIIITTISSFNLERFDAAIGKSPLEKLLIVDEAHRFTNRPEYIKNRYGYLLGLSATPYSGKSKLKGDQLVEYFGGCVFKLPIEDAIKKGFLVNYNYYPIYMNATYKEEVAFKTLSNKIASCFRNNICIDYDSLIIHMRSRLRLISMAEEKINRIDEIISKIKEKDHFIVYCGDGRLFDDNKLQEVRHIQFIKAALDKYGYKPSQFTATENIYKRMELVDAFNKGEISALAAIRCLDEGINIPSIMSALILSSNDDYREFVQRRGRILRPYKNKSFSNIYDVIIMPSSETPGLALIELRRFYEYAKLAINRDELLSSLEIMLDNYGYTMEDVDIYDTGMEEIIENE